MKEKAIIYNRRSQDRDDRQQNSLETQLNNSMDTLKKYNLEFFCEPIIESKSAKIEFKRVWFERMVSLCKKWWVDYIIVDEPKRLSRNNIDNSRIIDLMDKKLIKGILTTSREYYTKHPRDKFFLQFDLSLSKMDNEERGIDVSAKMLNALHRWQWLSKAIFWYKNVWPKWKKDVIVVESEAKIVRQCFIMRSLWKTKIEIARYLSLETWKKWNSEKVTRLLTNTRYYWLQEFWWEKAMLNSPWYEPIITEELFNKANGIFKIREYKKRDDIVKYFDWVIKDEDWRKLSGYLKKGNIYYHSTPQSRFKLNISEKKLFDFIESNIHYYDFPKPFISLTKATLKNYYEDKLKTKKTDLSETKKKINSIELKIKNLVDKYLWEELTKSIYDMTIKDLELELENYKEKYKAVESSKINLLRTIEEWCELVESLSNSYKQGSIEKKWKIIKSMQCELILNNKKELTIKESKLFEMIKSLNISQWYSHGELNPSSSLEKAMS